MRRTLFGLTLALSTSVVAHAANLAPSEAANHVGENATVCGFVASAQYADRSRGRPTFLNLGHAYPNQDVAAVIWGDERSKFGAPETLAGKRVCVTGDITLYRGRPEVILHDTSQLSQ